MNKYLKFRKKHNNMRYINVKTPHADGTCTPEITIGETKISHHFFGDVDKTLNPGQKYSCLITGFRAIPYNKVIRILEKNGFNINLTENEYKVIIETLKFEYDDYGNCADCNYYEKTGKDKSL